MKVAIITMYYPPDKNGIASCADSLASGFRKRGIRVTVITRQRPRPRPSKYIQQVNVPRVNLKDWRDRSIMNDGRRYCLKFARGVEKALEPSISRYDVVIFVSTWDDYLMADVGLRLRGINRKPQLMVVSGGGGKLAPRQMDKIRAGILNRVDQITAVSPDIKTLLCRTGVKKNIIRLIYPGVDLRLFKPKPKIATHSRKLNVLFAGRIDEARGVFDIVKTAQLLRRQPFYFHLVGEASFPAQRKQLTRLVRYLQLDNLSIESGVSNRQVAKLMSQADIFVYPSHEGWFSVSVLEAIASGLPCVVTNQGALPKLVRNKQNGFVIQPRDVKGMALALQKLKSATLRRKFSRFGRRLSGQYSQKQLIDKYLEIYEQKS